MNKLLLFIFSIAYTISINASHVPGGNISYQCISPNTYEITLTVYEDCGTAFISSSLESVNISNSCGIPFSNSISLPNFVYQQEVSQLCDLLLPQSECNALNFDDYFTISDANIFTPNGDNMNDEFIIEIPEKVEKCAELTIYNRWGQIQYFSTGNNLKWDGNNRVGGLAPPGSYFYTLKIQEKNFSGVLNLMR